MKEPMMFDPNDMILGILKGQMEEMETNKEKYEAEAQKRKATVEAIIEVLNGYSWEDAENLLKAAECEMKQRFFVSVNKVIDSEDVKI